MDLYLFQDVIFRDRTRLRCTRDGRLVIKNEVARELNMEATRHLNCQVQQFDRATGTLEVLFTKQADERSKPVTVNDISGTKILSLKNVLRKYSPLSAQYVSYKVEQQEVLRVTFKIPGK